MYSFLGMLLEIVQVVLNVAWWIIIVHAILSILIGFNVINTYNEFVGGLWRGLNALTEPLYRPFRRILPDLGPLDIAPLLVLVLIRILSSVVIPWMQGALIYGVAP